MRSEVLGQLQHLGWIELCIDELVRLLVEDGLEVVEAEADSFRDRLCRITCEEDVLRRHCHEQRDQVLRQILHLINHQEVHFD